MVAPRFWGSAVAKARYRFATDTKYFGWAVAAKAVELPALKRVVQAIKITLATPYIEECEGGKLVANQGAFEGIIWVFPPADVAILDTLEITVEGSRLTLPPTRSVCVWLTFGEPVGDGEYQPVTECVRVTEGTYLTAPVTVERSRTGLVFEGDKVTFLGQPITLPNGLAVKILRKLHLRFPERVSVAELRRIGEPWDEFMDIRPIRTAVSELKGLLPEGLTISRRDGDLGWCLVLTSPDVSRPVS